MRRVMMMLTLVIAILFMGTQAWATRGAMPHAYGTRATGLGSAFDAVSDDALSPTVYNPAGLTQIKDKRFDMDMIFLRPYQNFRNRNVNPMNGQNGRATAAGFIPEDNLLLNNDSNARTAKNNYFIMGGMGFAMRIGEKSVLGAGFVGRAGGGSFYHMNQSQFSFILPYDSNNTLGPALLGDDFLVPILNTRRGAIISQGTANIPFTDSLGLNPAVQTTRASSNAFFVRTENSTDLKIPEFGPGLGYEVNDYLSVGVSARLVAGHFRFKQAVGTGTEIMRGTGIFNNGQPLGDSAPQAVKDLGLNNYGGVISGKFKDPNLGGVQFGYQEVAGIGRLENSYSAGFGWGGGIHYRPFGSNKLVLSASYKSRAVMDFKGGELLFDFSDQFRKFYYDTGQFGEFATSPFGSERPDIIAGGAVTVPGTSYLNNGVQSLRAPKFFNALLGTIDYPASQLAHHQNALSSSPDPRLAAPDPQVSMETAAFAARAMDWFFNGTNKDGTPTLVRDGNNYARFINLTSIYDPYTQFALPRELAFGAAWRPIERLLLSLEYRLIYMDDMVGDFFTLTLDSGTSPFFDWLIGTNERGEFDFSMHTNFNTIRSISVGAEYDLGDKWTIRGGVQHSNNTFTANHIPFTFNMQPEDIFSGGFSYRLTENWELSFAGTVSATLDTTESKGTEQSDPARFVNGDGNVDADGNPLIDLSPGSPDYFANGSNIDQFHSNAEFDHKQWQVNFGIAYIW